MTEISLSGRGARGESQADILRRTGQFGVLPTDTDAEAVGKLNAVAALSAAAAAAIVPTLAANLDGVAWLSSEALTLAGAAAGLSWSSNAISIARAVKSFTWEGAPVNDRYYIGTFANDDATAKDRIIIRRVGDNVQIADLGVAAVVPRDASGLCTVLINSQSPNLGIRFRLVIDYREFTSTGVLINSLTVTPLIAARSGAGAINARRSQLSRHRNIALDPAGVSGTAIFQVGGALPPLVSATSDMQARGIVGARAIGTGTSATALYRREALGPRANGRQIGTSVYVSSANGTSWPSNALASAFFYANDTSSTILATVSCFVTFVQVTANLRRYFATCAVPASPAIGSVAFGFASMVSGTEALAGGWALYVSEAELSPDNVSIDDWGGFSTRDSWRDGVDSQLAIITPRASGYAPAFTNRWANGALDTLLPLPATVGASSVIGTPSSPAFRARSVQQVYRVGNGGSTGAMYAGQSDILIAGDVGQNYISALLVFSSDGTTWPSLSTFFYDSAGQNGSGVAMSGFVTIDANNRLYFATGTIPGPRSGNTFSGQVRSGINNNLSGSAASIEIGGAYFAVSATAINAATIAQDDFWPTALTKPRIAAAVRNSPTGRFGGKRMVFMGDSIIDDYGIPQAVAAALGLTGFNFAWAGSRMSTAAAGNFGPMGVCNIANAAAAADFSALATAAAAQYPTGSAYDVAKRAKAAAIAVFDWATVDYFVIGAGTNDWSGGVGLGLPSSTTTTEFNGAINEVVRQFQTLAPRAQFLFLTPAFRDSPVTSGGPNINSDTTAIGGNLLTAFGASILERSENRWHYPVCDMRKLLGINSSNITQFLSDRLHPNATGTTRWAGVIQQSAMAQLA